MLAESRWFAKEIGDRMLSWLFGRKGRIPDTNVVYAIGDIHGRDDLLARLHDSIEQELASAAEERDVTVIYLGDYIDRGPNSYAVIDRLLDRPIQRAKSVYLKGNHEDAMLRFLSGDEDGKKWLTIGGGATARSYGVSLRGEDNEALSPEVIRARLINAIPSRHMAFFHGLEMFHEAGDYLFVHAGIKPGRPLEQQDSNDLLWIRREFLKSNRRHEKIVVHGHSPGSEIVQKANRICVDTAAYATDRLSCVVLEGNQRRFLSTAL